MFSYEFTGKCKICQSPNGQAITRMMCSGVQYKDIMDAFPDENLHYSTFTDHKKHFVNPEDIADTLIPQTDTELIDRLRQLCGMYVMKAINGAPLNQSETRVIGEGVKAILGRKQLEDRQEQSEAFNRLLSRAVDAKWNPKKVDD